MIIPKITVLKQYTYIRRINIITKKLLLTKCLILFNAFKATCPCTEYLALSFHQRTAPVLYYLCIINRYHLSFNYAAEMKSNLTILGYSAFLST